MLKRFSYSLTTVVATLMVSSVVLSSCGSSLTRPGESSTVAPGTNWQLPFPVERSASAATDSDMNGNEAEQRSSGATEQGTDLVLDASSGRIEYAVYRFSFGDAPDHVDLTIAPGVHDVYVGVADYSTQRWVFFGPFNGATSVPLDPVRNVSPLGNVFIAVLVGPGAMATVETVDLSSWINTTPNPATGGGLFSSMTIINSMPAIAYVDEVTSMLKYVRATNADGTAWGASVLIDTNMSFHTCLAEVNGRPAITYRGNPGQMYVRALDAEGLAWPAAMQVDSPGADGSLIIVNGNPAISYGDSTNIDLKYIRANDANGDTWGTPLTLDSVDGVGNESSMAVVNGNPAIAYWDWSNMDLKYIRALDVNGATWGAPVVADGFLAVGNHPSLAVVDGRPAVAYVTNSGYIHYVRAADADGQTWGTPLFLNFAGGGGWPSLAVIGGMPAVAWHRVNISVGSLVYMEATSADGSTWRPELTLDIDSNEGSFPSLLEINGQPSISYYDPDNDGLKYIRRQ